MSLLKITSLIFLCLINVDAAFAQGVTSIQSAGASVIVPAIGEVTFLNDEANAVLMIEDQNKDKAVAASRVNQIMKQGMELIRKEDPQALLKTQGYYTFPVYSEEKTLRQNNKKELLGWRVGQYLEVTTRNLDALPTTIAAGQRVLALNGLSFRLSAAAKKDVDKKSIEASYRELNARIAAIAAAVGRNLSDVVIESLDFDGGGGVRPQDAYASKAMRAANIEPPQVEQPDFEPGETTATTRVVAKIKFK